VPSRIPSLAEFGQRFGGPLNAPQKAVLPTATPAGGVTLNEAAQTDAGLRDMLQQQQLRSTFDIMSPVSNYTSSPMPKAPATKADFDAVFGTPAPLSAVGVSAAPKLSPLPSKTVGYAPGMAPGQFLNQAPIYQPTSPMAAPIPRPNPLLAPQVAATPVAQPPSAFSKLAPGMISMAMAGGPLGVLGGFARLAAASLGNVNNPRGLGYDAATAARNAAVAAGVRSSDMIGGNMGGASYGRRQSDGTVTGTTRSGTGYTSSNGGDHISVGGRSYSKNSRGTYSQDL
jgi:hypothetical protein